MRISFKESNLIEIFFFQGSKIFGHPGYGGQMGAGDIQHQVGMGYLTNNLDIFSFIDPRYIALRDAFYECLLKKT